MEKWKSHEKASLPWQTGADEFHTNSAGELPAMHRIDEDPPRRNPVSHIYCTMAPNSNVPFLL